MQEPPFQLPTCVSPYPSDPDLYIQAFMSHIYTLENKQFSLGVSIAA